MVSKSLTASRSYLSIILPNPVFRWVLLSTAIAFLLMFAVSEFSTSSEFVNQIRDIQNELGAILIAIITITGAGVSIRDKFKDPEPELIEITESELFECLEHRVLKLAEPMMHGDDVRELQINLATRGHILSVDGMFGEETEKAVLEEQKKFGIVQDGIVGPITRARLRLLFQQQRDLSD